MEKDNYKMLLRIVEGCENAFYLATKDFVKFEKKDEKITAFRN